MISRWQSTLFRNNYSQQIALYEIAEAAKLSKYYFIKKLKEQTNFSPLIFLNNYRIEKSLYLLQHTDKKIKDIANELGFSDPNYFCKVFRQFTNLSPGEFRKNNTYQALGHIITDEQVD